MEKGNGKRVVCAWQWEEDGKKDEGRKRREKWRGGRLERDRERGKRREKEEKKVRGVRERWGGGAEQRGEGEIRGKEREREETRSKGEKCQKKKKKKKGEKIMWHVASCEWVRRDDEIFHSQLGYDTWQNGDYFYF
jgi:hypothetical protein